jgi:hypothetical protein
MHASECIAGLIDGARDGWAKEFIFEINGRQVCTSDDTPLTKTQIWVVGATHGGAAASNDKSKTQEPDNATQPTAHAHTLRNTFTSGSNPSSAPQPCPWASPAHTKCGQGEYVLSGLVPCVGKFLGLFHFCALFAGLPRHSLSSTLGWLQDRHSIHMRRFLPALPCPTHYPPPLNA